MYCLDKLSGTPLGTQRIPAPSLAAGRQDSTYPFIAMRGNPSSSNPLPDQQRELSKRFCCCHLQMAGTG